MKQEGIFNYYCNSCRLAVLWSLEISKYGCIEFSYFFQLVWPLEFF